MMDILQLFFSIKYTHHGCTYKNRIKFRYLIFISAYFFGFTPFLGKMINFALI